jgi:broad specificity phosphatase PhoE
VEIWLARHGATEWSRSGQHTSFTDLPLIADGEEEARALGRLIGDHPFDRVLSSPLRRARDTAAPIAAACDRAVEVDERLIEIDYGDWEGKPLAELSVDAATRWRADADFAPPGGESLHGVGRRMRSFCEERLDEHMVVAVSHVSPIKAAVCWTLSVGDEVAWRMRLDVASMTRIGVTPTGAVLLGLNETPAALTPTR